MELRIKYSSAFMAAVICMCISLPLEGAPVDNSEHEHEMEKFGLALGIPLGQDVGEPEAHVPQLLMDIYECWSSGSKDCLPVADSEVNVVRSLIGQFEERPPKAVQSFNHNRELTNAIAIKFNSSASFSNDILHTALLRVHKKALTQEQIDSLKSDCDLSNIQLQLYSTLPVDKDKDIVVLESYIPVSISSLATEEWLDFTNITHVYQTKLSETGFRLRLAMGGDCSDVSPSRFGIYASKSAVQPEFIGYAKSNVQEKILTDIANIQYRRRKRQVVEGSDEASNGTSNSTDIVSKTPSTIEEYQLAKCQLHEFNVSFAEIQWDRHIIRPDSYKANFCSGRCDWPLDQSHNYTKHSYIQSIVNYENSDTVPPPCCAPIPSELRSLAVVIREADNTFSTRWWTDMIATSCGCL